MRASDDRVERNPDPFHVTPSTGTTLSLPGTVSIQCAAIGVTEIECRISVT